ncbi:MAG: hypothetical protein AB8E15_13710 [Bdellovibrionales bacterium]
MNKNTKSQYKFYTAIFLSDLGLFFGLTALTVHFYRETKSSLFVGALFLAYRLPRILLSNMAGKIIDKGQNPNMVHIFAQIGSGIVLTSLIFSNYFKSPMLLLLGILILNIFSVFGSISRNTSIKYLTIGDQTKQSAVLTSMIPNLAMGFGALAGLFVARKTVRSIIPIK